MTSSIDHLRIIDADTWTRVQALLTAKGGTKAVEQRRPRYVFSGLLKCGACGSSYTSIGGKYPRLGCSGLRERGICTNTRIISVRIIEERVLGAVE